MGTQWETFEVHDKKDPIVCYSKHLAYFNLARCFIAFRLV